MPGERLEDLGDLVVGFERVSERLIETHLVDVVPPLLATEAAM